MIFYENLYKLVMIILQSKIYQEDMEVQSLINYFMSSADFTKFTITPKFINEE